MYKKLILDNIINGDKVKKIIILVIISALIISGCNLNNNPNSKVEELLTKYQMLDKDIVISSYDITNNNNLNNNLKKKYNKIVKNTYKNITYDIKDTKIDGNNATVTTEIEVYNNKSVINKYSINNYSGEEYYKHLLNGLEKNKEKVTYTIDFTLNKVNKTWILDDLTKEIELKLIGMY